MKFSDLSRVWRVTKKPNGKEYWLVVKIVFVGFVVIGIIGFVMELIWQFGLKHLF